MKQVQGVIQLWQPISSSSMYALSRLSDTIRLLETIGYRKDIFDALSVNDPLVKGSLDDEAKCSVPPQVWTDIEVCTGR